MPGKNKVPKDRGSYSLLIYLGNPTEIRVGKLGKLFFPQGYYVYTGSALNGLEARVGRHLQKEKKRRHWHIDYLLSVPQSKVVGVQYYPGLLQEECRHNQRMARLPQARSLHPRFGASDCRAFCPSHLFYLGRYRPANFRSPPAP